MESDQALNQLAQAAETYTDQVLNAMGQAQAEFLGSDETIKKQRLTSLQTKLATFVVKIASGELTSLPHDPNTVADSLVEILPSTVEKRANDTADKEKQAGREPESGPTSKSQAKAQQNLESWFLPSSGQEIKVTEQAPDGREFTRTKKITGGSIEQTLQHHQSFTQQMAAQLRKELANNPEAPAQPIFIVNEQATLYELTTKTHLQDESARTGHCVGTASSYGHKLETGSGRFFSLRLGGDSGEYRITIEYDEASHAIGQIKGPDNQMIEPDNAAWSPLMTSLSQLGSLLDKPDRYLRIEDLPTPPKNQALMLDGSFKTILELTPADNKNILKINMLVGEQADLERLPENYKDLMALPGCDVSFNSANQELLAKFMQNIESIGGSAYFRNLTSSTGLESLANIGGHADFNDLTSSAGLESLANIGGYADFYSLTSSAGLESLANIGGDAWFSKLTSSAGLESLANIGGDANFTYLTSSAGLESLANIGGHADFHNLTSSTGLEALANIGGNAYFHNLTSSAGLESLANIGGSAYFTNLTSSAGLESLASIGGNITAGALTYAAILEIIENNKARKEAKTS